MRKSSLGGIHHKKGSFTGKIGAITPFNCMKGDLKGMRAPKLPASPLLLSGEKV